LTKKHPELTALYGLVFHPLFDHNRHVYVCDVGKNNEAEGTVIARFTVSASNPPVIDSASEQIIPSFWSGGHNGGCLAFGIDWYIYISKLYGNDPAPPDSMITGQDCSDLLSSIVRIDVDRTELGVAYRIPRDNPFVNVQGVRPRSGP
jgi:hypothetical protein